MQKSSEGLNTQARATTGGQDGPPSHERCNSRYSIGSTAHPCQDGSGRSKASGLAEAQPGILSILGALSTELFAGDRLDSVLAQLLAQLAAVIDVPYGAIYENEADSPGTSPNVMKSIACHIGAGSQSEEQDEAWRGQRVSYSASSYQQLVRGEPVCATVAEGTANGVFPPAVGSLLCLPIAKRGSMWGVLCLGQRSPAPEWEKDQIEALQRVAQALGLALECRARATSSPEDVASENARLYEEARQRANELELLHQVAIATATLVDVDKLIEETTRFIAERIYTDVFGFLLLDEDVGQFMPHPSYHGLPPGGTETSVPLGESISGTVARTGRPMVVPDVSREPLYFPIVKETRSEISVPMIAGDRVIGVINVESRERNAFSESDLRFLKTLAGQVVTAMERAQLYKEMEEHASRLAEKVRERTIELEQERDRMLAILDSAGEGIVFTDVEARILYVNPAMERQTGYPREACMGQTPHLWMSELNEQEVFEEMWQTVLEGRRWQGELVNQRMDGSLFDAALTITPQINRAGQICGFVGVQADISRFKEVERLKSQFIANVSHELRAPLTNIRNYLTLMERGKVDQRERYMAVIGQETERLTRLIQDLLDLSTLEAQEVESPPGDVEIGPLVSKVVGAFTAEAERKEIALTTDVPAELPSLTAVESQVEQVLNNLVANALAYTPPRGSVKVAAGSGEPERGRMLWLRVSDDGPGIEKDELPHLFSRFFRGSAAALSDSPGTGLGLSICKEILDNHGGRIDVDSVPRQGTTFTVWWPLYATEANNGNS